MYSYLIDNIIERPVYKYLPTVSTAFATLKAKRNDFEALSLFNQIHIVFRCYQLISCKSDRVDLSLIGLSSSQGVKTINKHLTIGTKLIEKSITGFYEKTIFEVTKS